MSIEIQIEKKKRKIHLWKTTRCTYYYDTELRVVLRGHTRLMLFKTETRCDGQWFDYDSMKNEWNLLYGIPSSEQLIFFFSFFFLILKEKKPHRKRPPWGALPKDINFVLNSCDIVLIFRFYRVREMCHTNKLLRKIWYTEGWKEILAVQCKNERTKHKPLQNINGKNVIMARV